MDTNVESTRFPAPAWNYLRDGLDAGEWEQLEPYFKELESREIRSVEELERWLLDLSELESKLCAEEARRYIAMTCDTESEETRERYLEFNRKIDPPVKLACDRLDRLYLASPFRSALPLPRFSVFDRFKESDASLFCEANVELELRETELVARHTEIAGAFAIELDGKRMTFAEVGLVLEESDRARREEAWRKVAARRMQEREKLDAIYGEMVKVRQQIARNSNCANFRDYRFKKLHRFDYGVADCEALHDAVKRVVVPIASKINAARRSALGADTLRPWDLDVDPLSSEPFRPFQSEDELCELTKRLFAVVDPEFAEDFAELERARLLDLFSRQGKSPGGYQYFLEDVRLPFIFANAAGTHDDVQTLLHEGGHAFHSLLARDEEIGLYRDAPIEFCEVASMGMEFLAFEHLREVYPEAEAIRMRRVHLDRQVRLFAWIMIVDSFQHWVYTQDEVDPGARSEAWIALRSTYTPDLDWSGLDDYLAMEWQRQGHIFRQPFYYIEYGIALLGALQLWVVAKRDPARALTGYRRALALGGSRPLPELFTAAGLRFEFSVELVEELLGEVFTEWKRLHDVATSSSDSRQG